MKAISLHQPWASMIARGEKTIETRMWPTNHRGRLLICAAKTVKGQGPIGVAVAIVNVISCRPMTDLDEQAACYPNEKGRWAWVLYNIWPIPEPFPVTGRQRLFDADVPNNVLDVYREWLRSTHPNERNPPHTSAVSPA
jgi:hypothetical protein